MHFIQPSLTEKLFDEAFRYVREVNSTPPLVNFFVVGTAKAGTTALHAFLDQHPEICMPYTTKELNFFDNDRYFLNLNSIRPPYRKYHRNFAPTPHTKVCGEACPNYMWNEKSVERIFEYNPSSKIIVLLRNPISRAFSHWNMAHSKSNDKLSFTEAISKEVERVRVKYPRKKLKAYTSYQEKTFSHIDRGYYSGQIRRIFRFFPKENVRIFLAEDLKSNHDETLITIFDFLEVNKTTKIKPDIIHKRPYKNSLNDNEFKALKTVFEPEIRSLELLIDRNLDHWLM